MSYISKSESFKFDSKGLELDLIQVAVNFKD
jgi:hypothetical protein